MSVALNSKRLNNHKTCDAISTADWVSVISLIEECGKKSEDFNVNLGLAGSLQMQFNEILNINTNTQTKREKSI